MAGRREIRGEPDKVRAVRAVVWVRRVPSLRPVRLKVEETDTDPPAHELERSLAIVRHPGRTYET